MASTALLTHDAIGTAWRFVDDCIDDDPRGYGVENFPALVARCRDGVFRARSAGAEYDAWARREAVEDALIAMIDGEVENDVEA